MWHIGAHRYVWVVGNIVVKFPRIRLIHFFGLILDDIKDRKLFWTSWYWFKTIVLCGVMENIRETRCYLSTKHNLLTTLRLPLILVNVYQREDRVGDFTFGGDELTEKVYKTGDREYLEALLPCSHTFDHVENFAFSNGRVKILDYGEKGFQNLLEKFGDRIEVLLRSVVKQSA